MKANFRFKKAEYVLFMAFLLAGCTANGSEATTLSTPTPESTLHTNTTDTVVESVSSEPSRTAAITLVDKLLIGESDIGKIYAWENKLFAKNQEGVLTGIGGLDSDKFNAVLSEDGGRILYNRVELKETSAQTSCELTLLDLESGQETPLSRNDQVEPCHYFGWLGNHVYVQWNEYPAPFAGDTSFTVFDGRNGEQLESGRMYQYLEDSQTRIVLLHSNIPFEERDGLEVNIRIAALTKDGAFHLLWEQPVYEEQFRDIQLSKTLGAMAIWTHHVPTNTARLWMAYVDPEQWSSGEWTESEIKPSSEAGRISFEEEGFVLLSDGRRYQVP
jgi:hypothetical protein